MMSGDGLVPSRYRTPFVLGCMEICRAGTGHSLTTETIGYTDFLFDADDVLLVMTPAFRQKYTIPRTRLIVSMAPGR